MEENISWKIVYLATTFSLLVLGIAYYLIAPHDNTFFSEEKINKIGKAIKLQDLMKENPKGKKVRIIG